MKIFKIYILISVIFYAFMMMTACGVSVGTTDVVKIKSVEDFPSLEEFNKLPNTEVADIEHAIFNNSAEEAKEYFTKKLGKYIADMGRLSISSLNIREDKLMMDSNENIRVFRDLFVDLSLRWDVDGLELQQQRDLLEEISVVIGKMFSEGDVFAWYRVNEFDFSITKLQSGVVHKTLNTRAGGVSALKVKLSEDELATQTLTYNSVRKNIGFLLRKFGVIEDKKELYIEVYIQEWYNKKGKNIVSTEEDLLEITNKTKEESNKLYNKIISDKNGKKLIENNGLTTITMAFYSKFLEGGCTTYNFEIE